MVSFSISSIISRHLFSRQIGIQVSKKAKDRDAPVVNAFHPVSLYVYWDNPSRLSIFLYPSSTPNSFTHTIYT